MNNLDPLSQTPLNSIPKWIPLSFLGVSFLGFLDAAYLSAEHFLGIPLVCSIVSQCEQVLNSSYSFILGVPVALLGALYYLSIFLLVIAFFDTKKIVFLKLASLLPIAGLVFSIWFVFVQAFLLEAFCLYCLASAAITTILFILSVIFIWKFWKNGIY